MKLSRAESELIKLALKEDIGAGDITTRALGLGGRRGKAEVVAKGDGVISGIDLFKAVFQTLSDRISFKVVKDDSRSVKPGDRIISLTGPLGIMLTGERTSMNILSHLSGVATLTRRFVEMTKGYRARVLDTRKTMPGMRNWEKRAVRHGGGDNHRMGLNDMYLIKENHIAAAGDLRRALESAVSHRKKTKTKLEVEVRNIRELKTVLPYHPDYILLDNFTVANLKRAVSMVKMIRPKPTLEASGNVNLKNISGIAATGIDRISIGAITHSAPVLDLSFKVLES